ncbi:ABC transporter permease [Amycolatopsis acidicola]|uniref:ABC transporter permease n=1 Tax=Amycolatopsis acidicola TaxID=2596893 RepID=A0A5N0V972_9PSEU|nr:ABC transporter permease [Amycolatopsis acidicola]KAA9161813.1 ABC transporter permease [Amycolatopsis acidicola]
MRVALRRLIGLIAFLVLWEVIVRVGLLPSNVLPPASTVLVRFAGLFGNADFITGAVSTLLSWAIALGLTVLIAVPLGVLLGSVRWLRLSISPIVEFLRPLPAVALIPLVILLLGSDAQTKITLAVFASVWPVLFNTIYAMGEIDRQILDTARVYRTPPLRQLFTVLLPSIAPFTMTGVRLSASISLIVLVTTEYLTLGTVGIGQFVYFSGTTSGRMDMVLAATVFIGLAGYLVNSGLLGVQRRWLGWAAAGGAV